MRKHSYVILLLLTAFMWAVSSSNTCRQRLAVDCCQTENATNGLIVNAYGTSNSTEQQISFLLSAPDCALPVQIEKIQVNVAHLSARQQLKRISETIFGHNADTLTTHRIAQRIIRSQHILLNLETYDIGFPFSVFW